MSEIIYEYLSNNPFYRLVSRSSSDSWNCISSYQDLKSTIYNTYLQKKEKSHFLLDEDRFSFFRFDISIDKDESMSIHELNKIIMDKCDLVKKEHHATGKKLMTIIDSIYIDGEEKKHIVGEKGHIFFRLYVIYLNTDIVHRFDSVYGDILQSENISIMPQSMNTALFLRDTLKKDNFLLLYIRENHVKAIKISHGFYDQMYTLNLGIDAVKKMYKDNGISNYRYKDYDFIEKNELAKQLVEETLEFYSEMLCKRLQDNYCSNTDVILISSMTRNGHFLERFNRVYSRLSNNYIVPFHRAQNLDTFNKTRDPEDMDILVTINGI